MEQASIIPTYLKNVLTVNKPGSGCDYHRIFLPYRELVDFEKLPASYADAAVVVMNRTSIEGHDALAAAKRKHGFKVILDLDDYWNLYPHHHDYVAWINGMIPKAITKHIQLADVITVTNQQLADEVLKLRPEATVEIIPNALPFDQDQFTDEREEADTFRFFYAGGSTHAFDIGVLREPIREMNSTQTGHEFILAGYRSSPDNIKDQWDNMMRVFYPNMDPSAWPIRKGRLLSKYMELYKEADVVLVPLEDNQFNRCKSNLKVLEAGCKRVPVIASCVLPYYNELDKPYLSYAESPRSWYELMRLMMRNPNYVRDQGEALGEHVRKHYDLKKVNEHRRQIVQSLL